MSENVPKIAVDVVETNYCKMCHYKCSRPDTLVRHCLTSKHQKVVNRLTIVVENEEN